MYALMVSPLNVKNVANFAMRISPFLADLPPCRRFSPNPPPPSSRPRASGGCLSLSSTTDVRRAGAVARLQREPGHRLGRTPWAALRRALDPRARAQRAPERRAARRGADDLS